MTSLTCWVRAALLPACLVAAFSLLPAQNNNVLAIQPVEKLTIKRGTTAEVKVKADLQPGFHVNSNAPAEEYLIPLKLTWAKEPLEAEQVVYPKPQFENYAFSPKPVSVFSGTFEILTRFKAPASAANGMAMMTGKLRYQACNNKECLPPRSIDVKVMLDIQ